MIKVAGIWELGWSAPITEAHLWSYPLRDFGVDEWCMSPVSGIADTAVKEYPEVKDVIAANPDLTVVFCDENGTQTLSEFQHPENALYVFGKAGQSPFVSLFKEGDLSLKIETHANLGLLWPHQAVTIILHDRLMKQR